MRYRETVKKVHKKNGFSINPRLKKEYDNCRSKRCFDSLHNNNEFSALYSAGDSANLFAGVCIAQEKTEPCHHEPCGFMQGEVISLLNLLEIA